MSAPDTNAERDSRAHVAPKIGIAGAVIFAALMIVLLLSTVIERADAPAPAGANVDATQSEGADATGAAALTGEDAN